jgi:Uncharacterized protein conserved in bacteria
MENHDEGLTELLDAEELEKQRSKAMDKALFYLGFKARSEAQMERYLLSKEFCAEAVDIVMQQLKEYGYIDDERMAERLLEAGKTQRKEGVRKTRQRLMRTGIPQDVSAQVTSEVDEETELQNAAHWIARWLPRLTGDRNHQKQKLYRRLLGKGFSYEIVNRAMRDVRWPEEDEEERYD